MWSIIRHDLQKTRSLIILGVLILLSLFVGSEASNISEARETLVIKSLIISLIYAGVMYLSLYFSDQKHGTLFFLLSSPQSRTRIYWAKIVTVLIPVFVLLLVQMVAIAYKDFNFEAAALRALPGVLYLCLANILFFGSVCALLSQFMGGGMVRWLNALITVYAVGAFIYLLFTLNVDPRAIPDAFRFKALEIVFYQHLIFFSDNNYLHASLFLLAGIVLFFVGFQIFIRRNFYSV